jgi:VanZ family protein
MLPLRYPRLWLTLGWTAVVFAIVVSLAPISQLPQPGVSDKTEHFAAYLLLTLWFAGIYPRSRYWIIGIGLCVMGVLIEFAQGAMRFGRHADIMDVFANSSGIVAGLVLSLLLLGGWALRIESLLTKSVVKKP